MDIIRLYQDHNVPFLTEGNKHCTKGWVNTHCPFCEGEQNYHLGFPISGQVFRCWRCGIHGIVPTFSALLNISYKQAEQLIIEYEGYLAEKPTEPEEKQKKPFALPSNIVPINGKYARYLSERGFNVRSLIKNWNIQATGPVSSLDGTKYKFRIIAPIYWNGELVSFQGRDITNKNPFKYLACPKDREIIHHKHIIYKHPEQNTDKVFIVEGITDVWAIGKNAVSTFGIEFKNEQIRLLAQMYKRAIILFDSEKQAVKKAEELTFELRFRGVDAHMIILTQGDPAELSIEEIDKIKKEL